MFAKVALSSRRSLHVIGLALKRAKAHDARRETVQQIDEAFRMLDAFASVGATHFDLTHTDIDGEKRGFRPRQSLAQLKNSLPKLFPGAAVAAEQHHRPADER
jgi:hypothetical protein